MCFKWFNTCWTLNTNSYLFFEEVLTSTEWFMRCYANAIDKLTQTYHYIRVLGNDKCIYFEFKDFQFCDDGFLSHSF